ncbi:hypothetical protein D917_01114 [Trichinella nativa]|uniref:Uncharacterized protein n=1 Tax=Trichinella nativa TaxID=6335 RepID=A0A1Y3EU34_9BILA|nr:hypothetical protein D917_01114 [Trichinella nativa]
MYNIAVNFIFSSINADSHSRRIYLENLMQRTMFSQKAMISPKCIICIVACEETFPSAVSMLFHLCKFNIPLSKLKIHLKNISLLKVRPLCHVSSVWLLIHIFSKCLHGRVSAECSDVQWLCDDVKRILLRRTDFVNIDKS